VARQFRGIDGPNAKSASLYNLHRGMPRTSIHPLHWELIVKRIHEGFCVPFLGAGVNVRSAGYEGLPLGSDVALQLVKRMIGLKQESLWKATASLIATARASSRRPSSRRNSSSDDPTCRFAFLIS